MTSPIFQSDSERACGRIKRGKEKQREEALSDELHRNTALKLAELKRDQYRCQWAGCAVDQRHMLEVHHKRPLSEGERPSKLADVITYCANHHREAHHLMRQTT